MKCYISVVCVLSAFVAVILAAPTTTSDEQFAIIVPVQDRVKRQTADDQQQAIDRIVKFSNEKISQLRKLCPQLFEIIDNVVQNVTSQVFRVVGGTLLRSGGLGGGGGSSSGGSGGGGRVSVVLPTFAPDEDEDEDDGDEEVQSLSLRARIGGDSSTPVALSATLNNEIDDSPVSRTTLAAVTRTAITTVRIAEASSTEDSSTLAPFTSPSLVRRSRAASDDQTAAASGGSVPDPAEDTANADSDDADRNKRFLPFGGEGSAGGSGNFLFDLIRNTADRAARTVGTVYRMVAGTENIGFGLSATATSSKTLANVPGSQLVAGSGATEETDEKEAGGVAEVDVAGKSTEGIPGPITRLLVVANRGIANLIQDLILRLASTSERIVNFKARLITSLI